MKLVEILARELLEWPRFVTSISQDSDLQVSHYSYTNQVWTTDYMGCWDTEGYIPLSRFTLKFLADDHTTAIVTREMWEAEKQRIPSSCEGTTKEVVQGCALYDPIKSRDRIYEIDSLVESLEEERVALVQGLEDEGFKLVGKGVKGDDCDQPAEYMSDPSNWKKGDIVEAVSECWQVCEYRPAITLDNHQEALPKVGDKLLYSLGMDIWYECEIKYVVPNYGVVALCQPIDGECEQWLDTTTKFKPLPLTEEEKYEELLRDVSQHCSWFDITNHLYKLGYHK